MSGLRRLIAFSCMLMLSLGHGSLASASLLAESHGESKISTHLQSTAVGFEQPGAAAASAQDCATGQGHDHASLDHEASCHTQSCPTLPPAALPMLGDKAMTVAAALKTEAPAANHALELRPPRSTGL